MKFRGSERARARHGRTMGNYIPRPMIKGVNRHRKVARTLETHLTGSQIRMVRGRRAGLEGVLKERYLRGPGYWAKLEDGAEEVARPWEFEVIS